MLKRVALILALLVTSAAADDYRSYRQAYAGVNWPSSVTSTEQCQQRVGDVVARFGFTDAEFRTDRLTSDLNLWVKDQKHHLRIAFGCDPRKRMVTIDINSWEGQTGSAADLLDALINSIAAQ
jgi:hypothetical protein